MRRFMCFLSAALGFVVAATICYLVFVEGLRWDRGVVKISAPIAMFGAIIGWEVVEKGANLLFGKPEQKQA